MNDRQARTIKALSQVLAFLGQLPDYPPPPARFAELREDLAILRNRIRELHLQQETARKGMKDATRELEALRQHIRREGMKAIVRIAKSTLKFAPGEGAMTVPPTRASSEAVVKSASQMLKVMRTHAKLLASAGLSKDFLTQFDNEVQRLKAESGRVVNGRLQYKRATRSLTNGFAKVMKAFTFVEGALIAHYGSESTVLANWLDARRVPAKAGRPRESGSQHGEIGPEAARS